MSPKSNTPPPPKAPQIKLKLLIETLEFSHMEEHVKSCTQEIRKHWKHPEGLQHAISGLGPLVNLEKYNQVLKYTWVHVIVLALASK